MKDIKNTTDKDLKKELSQKRESLKSFRFGISGSRIKNVKEGKNLKKNIARALTEIKIRG